MSDAPWCIRANGLGKYFARRTGQLTAFSVLRRAVRSHGDDGSVLHALEGITFDVRLRELVGLIGDNGAGKTTLLKTIAGIYRPTRGEVVVRGELGLLSGLGVGMVGDLTVRDNIYLYGSICRLSRERIDALFDDIVAWAELTDFVRAPLRTLSTGMKSRLAFAVVVHIDADVLLIDEALSAGDQRFKQKCDAHLETLRDGDTAALISTHDLTFVERHCRRTLWLRRGVMQAFGPTSEVVAEYQRNGR